MTKVHKAVIDDALRLIDSDKSQEFIDELHGNLIRSIEKTRGLHKAVISTAVELIDDEKSQLEKLITGIFQKKIETIFKTDKNILGGFRIVVGDWKLDATVNNDLIQLKQKLLS